MRLLLSDADLRQVVNDGLGLDFEFASQFVDPISEVLAYSCLRR
jgi:hypothetical protein